MNMAGKAVGVVCLVGALVTSAFAAGANDGEVRKIDRSASKMTIRHGPLPALDMPPMTMVFQVRDKALLDRVKPGDKVKFDAIREGGAYIVTNVEPVP